MEVVVEAMVAAVLVMVEVEVEVEEVEEGVGLERMRRSVGAAERSPAGEVAGLVGGESREGPRWSPPGGPGQGRGSGGRQ